MMTPIKFSIWGCMVISLLGCAELPKDSTVPFMLTGYAAKQTCSCVFVSQRSLASCKAEYDAGFSRVLSWQQGIDTITVSNGEISHTARFETGFGCHPID